MVFLQNPHVMKVLFTLLGLTIATAVFGQAPPAKNIIIITTDGFRWQEVFAGADAALITNPRYVKDTAMAKAMFWNDDLNERRKKLMPFMWDVIAGQGQLYGNRHYGNKVDVANIFKISYPGYNEIFTGYADLRGIPNVPVKNSNTNILEYLNNMPEYHGKVAAFTSWNMFPAIFNRKRSGFTLNSGYEKMVMMDSSSDEALVNNLQDSVAHKTHTRHDELTFLRAMDYLKHNKPRVLFVGLGETDECAHGGEYDKYLQKAVKVDAMIEKLWNYVQADANYKDNTIFIITTDHGRGAKPNRWYRHGIFTKGSGQVWLAMLGPGITPLGEVKTGLKIYQKQLAATVAMLLGERFITNHPVAVNLKLPPGAVLPSIAVGQLNKTTLAGK